MFAYVGCRTTKQRNARGRGVGVWRIDAAGGWTLEQCAEGLDNPSWLTLNREGTRLYAVHGDGGEVSAYAVDQTRGTLRFLNARACGGRNPVHLILDGAGRHALVANFATGTLGALALDAEGALGDLTDVANVPGAVGPWRGQQRGSHPHQIVRDPGGGLLLVPDKGCDQISIYSFDGEAGRFTRRGAVQARQASAPRHCAVSPATARVFVANELESTLTTYRWDGAAGTLAPLHRLSTLPADFCADNTAAGVVLAGDGRTLYVSNRGHDSIAVFTVDPATGLPAPRQHAPTGGREPRFITLDPAGRRLFAGNENSDAIVAFDIDAASGLLSPAKPVIATGSPTCIVFSRV